MDKIYNTLKQNIEQANSAFIQEVRRQQPRNMSQFIQMPVTPFSNIHNIIISKEEKVLFSADFEGIDPDLSWSENYILDRRSNPLDVMYFSSEKIHTTRSITKSIVGILLINALKASKNGLTVTSRISDVFPELNDYRSVIRISDVLNMAIPMHWDECNLPYNDPDNPEYRMVVSKNPYLYSLEKLRDYLIEDGLCPDEYKKIVGEKSRYNSCMTALSASMIERLTGKDLEHYAKEVIFEPMKIDYIWDRLKYSGLASFSSGLRLSPNGMLKIAQSLLRDWLSNKDEKEAQDPLSLMRRFCVGTQGLYKSCYGLHAWLVDLNFAERKGTFRIVLFTGVGGNVVAILPEEQLIYVITGGNYTKLSVINTSPYSSIVKDFILPGCGLTTI